MPSFLQQRVNSYLCMALLALMCFWTGLYYFVHKADTVAASWTGQEASAEAHK